MSNTLDLAFETCSHSSANDGFIATTALRFRLVVFYFTPLPDAPKDLATHETTYILKSVSAPRMGHEGKNPLQLHRDQSVL